MLNLNYSYKDISLWNLEEWNERYSSICPLAQWIGSRNLSRMKNRIKTDIYGERTDGIFDYKTHSNTYPDVTEYWNNKGLFYKCSEMAGLCWIAMIPNTIVRRELKNPRVIVVVDSVDYQDPNWAMNTIEFYHSYNELAIKENLVILYSTANGQDRRNVYINILEELGSIYHLKLDRVYMDISTVLLEGEKLREIKEFEYKNLDGLKVENPDEAIEYIGEIPVLDITGRWQNKVSHLLSIAKMGMQKDSPIKLEKHIHSGCGRKQAEAMRIEYDYDSMEDPEFIKYLEDKGLRYESHDYKGEQWMSLVPTCINENKEIEIPVMLIMQEVTYTSPFQLVSAISNFKEYIDLVAQGELMLIFFALETPDDNDLLLEIVDVAAQSYTIDLTRIYLTGFSHNAHFAMEFSRRHHVKIAAVAALGMSHGIPAPAYSHEVLKVTDQMVDLMSTYDMPLININGYHENLFVTDPVDSEQYQNGISSFQRRLKACNCPEKTKEEIENARFDTNYIRAKLGIPGDEVELQNRMGSECYITDILNKEGKKHLRLVTIENMPHIYAPQMPGLSWDFVKRFARNLETGEVIQRY